MSVFKLNFSFYLTFIAFIASIQSIDKPSFNDEVPGVLSNPNYAECKKFILLINILNQRRYFLRHTL